MTVEELRSLLNSLPAPLDSHEVVILREDDSCIYLDSHLKVQGEAFEIDGKVVLLPVFESAEAGL